jgi:RNA polymerase sigma factor for flagellar operon FliA
LDSKFGMEAVANAYRTVAHKHGRDQLIVDHLAFVRHLLGRMSASLPRGLDFENLEAAGILGLVEAAGQFDPHRGVPFKTFAYPRIRGAILDELRRNCPLPQHMLQRWNSLRKASSGMQVPRTVENLAKAAGMSTDEVEECFDAIRVTRPETWHEDLAPSSVIRRIDPGEGMEEDEDRRLMADAVESLPRQERLVVSMYYMDDMRLKEIGDVLGLSESRISRILARAQLRMQEFVRRQR